MRRTPLLWLLQLSDTALPIGALNHSYGLETLTVEQSLGADGLKHFCRVLGNRFAKFISDGAAYRLGIAGHDQIPDRAVA